MPSTKEDIIALLNEVKAKVSQLEGIAERELTALEDAIIAVIHRIGQQARTTQPKADPVKSPEADAKADAK